MRLFCAVFVAYLSFSLNAALGLASPQPSIRLPELPEHNPQAFYYIQVMTAHKHGQILRNADGKPIKVSFAIKIFTEDTEEEDALIIIRDPNDYNNCDRLTSNKVRHRNTPSGHLVSINDSIRNTEGQKFELSWAYRPNQNEHYLKRFVIYLAESTNAHPLNFISLPKDNPLERPDTLQAEIAENYFRGTNPDCE